MSDDADILARLREVLARFFNNPGLAVDASTTARDVRGWDSLANVELMVEIEEAFAIRFRTGEVAGLKNVGELIGVIARRTKA
jgi:acyl carrier protein